MPILFAAALTITASGPPIPAAEKTARPPTHADLGKSTRDVFTKDYGFGLIKLYLEIKPENGLEFISSGSASTEPTKLSLSIVNPVRSDVYRQHHELWGHYGGTECMWTEADHWFVLWPNPGEILKSRHGTRGNISTWAVRELWHLWVHWYWALRVGWLPDEVWNLEIPSDPEQLGSWL